MTKKEIIIVGFSILIGFCIMILFKIQCPIKFIFDIECAGCGATRMLFSLVHLDFYQAFRFNPLVFILLIIGLLYLLYVLICKVLKKKYIKVGTKTFVILMIFVILFMILRNIDSFEFLKPTIVR